MSLYTWVDKSWTRPRVWVERETLYAKTAIFIQIISLFSYCRLVKVNRKWRFIQITTKWLWCLKKRRWIPFARISRIETDFSSIPTAIGPMGWTDRYEEFSVFLRLQNPYEYCWLISFGGEGCLLTGWKGVLLGGDSIVDMQGDQEATFQTYYTLLVTTYPTYANL